MSNGQVATLLQNLLMIGGTFAVASGKVSAPDAQNIIGAISTLVGFTWNHWAQAAKTSAAS